MCLRHLEAISCQQSRMGRAAISAAAEEMAAGCWQHHPHSCALQVPVVMSCIHNNLEHISAASGRHTLDALLLRMAELWPVDTVLSLTCLSPECDRYGPHSPCGFLPCGERGLEAQRKLQGPPEEQGPAPHRSLQPCWVGQACSSQSWPSQTRDPARGSSLPHGEHHLSPLLPAQAGTRALQARGWERPGLQDSLAAARLAQAPCGG